VSGVRDTPLRVTVLQRVRHDDMRLVFTVAGLYDCGTPPTSPYTPVSALPPCRYNQPSVEDEGIAVKVRERGVEGVRRRRAGQGERTLVC
jgi:hypothetical protein